MEKYTDQELRSIYEACQKARESQIQKSELLLNTYNDIFKSDDGFLHYWMTKEVLKVVTEEMAERFFNQG